MLTELHFGQSLSNVDMVYRRQNGSECFMVSRIYPICDKREEVQGFVFANTDITELKRVELALEESEALYQDLVETAQDLIWQCDVEGCFVYLNPACESVMGYKVNEVLGKRFSDFQSPEFASKSWSMHSQLLKGNIIRDEETVFFAKDGQEVYLMLNAKAVYDQSGEIVGTRGIAYNVTHRKRAEQALLKSELLLRESQKLSQMGHYDLDILTGIWESSDNLNALFGIDWNYKTNVEGWLGVVHPDDREKMAAYFTDEVLTKRQNFDLEYRIVRINDGEPRWVHGLGRLEYDKEGKPIRMLGNIQDITERKNSEDALRESEERLKLLASAAHEGIVFTEAGKVIEANTQLARMLGCELSELIGKSVMDFVAPESLSTVLEKIRSGAAELYEHLAMKKDGTIFPVEVRAQMMSVQGKKVRVSAILDVTERKRVELSLLEREAKIQSIFRAAPVGIGMVIDRVLQEANHMLCEITGYTRDELIGQSSRKLYPSTEEYEIVGNEKYRMIKVAGRGTVETRWKRKDGEIRDILLSSVPLDVNDLSKGVTFTALDITERKSMENSLRLKTTELESLFSISAHLRSAQSADAMLPLVLEETRRVLHSDANAIILLDPDGKYFTYTLSDGPLRVNIGKKFPARKSISGVVMRSLRPYTTDDLSTDSNRTSVLQGDETLGPAAVVPVTSESAFLGVLVCARQKRSETQSFSISEVQLLTAIGEMVGNALRRARLYDQAMTRLQHVQSLHSIDMAISANLNLSVILDVLLSQGIALLDVDAACILLLDPHTHLLEFSAGKGFHAKEIRSARLRLGEGLPGQVAMSRKVVRIANLSDANDLVRKHLLEDGFVDYLAAPLVAKGQLQGVLEIFNRQPLIIGDEQVGFLETLATQAAIAIDNSQLFGELQQSNFELEMAYDATIEGWSRALELRDQETEGHTLRVTDMTLRLAQAIGVKNDELVHIRRGALLHDIGKMGIPDRILLKPGKLDADEWVIMKQHTIYAFEMLWPIEFLRKAIDIPNCHHERWDGTGYPRGLKGEQIPLSARLFAVADVMDALTNDRPYRKAWTEEQALEYIISNSGKHFDPQVVDIFLALRNLEEK